MNAPPRIERRHSACPHDCPSTCALDVEVLDGRTHRPRAWRGGQQLHGRRHLRQGRALCRAHPSSRPADCIRCGAIGPKGSGQFAAHLLGRRARPRRRGVPRRPSGRSGREAVWPYYYAGTMGLVHARRHQPAAPRQAILRHVRHDLHQHGLDRLHRRHRQARRRRSARDGEVRLRRDLGHQRGQHPGQRDDPRGRAPARSAAPRSSSSTSTTTRTMQQADLALLRASPAPTARSPARSCTCCSATATPTGSISTNTPTARASSRRISRTRDPEWASAITGLSGRRDRGLRAGSSARRKRTFFRLGYGFARSAQRRRQHACRARASRRSPAPGSTRAAAPSTTTARSTTGTRP